MKPGKPTHFVVDARSAGAGDLKPVVKDEKGNDVPCSVTDHMNGQYTVEYTPPAAGKYKVNATFAGKQIPKLPVDINVTPPADVSKVKVDGLEPSKYCHISGSPRGAFINFPFGYHTHTHTLCMRACQH